MLIHPQFNTGFVKELAGGSKPRKNIGDGCEKKYSKSATSNEHTYIDKAVPIHVSAAFSVNTISF